MLAVLILAGTAQARLEIKWAEGKKIVYDTTNDWWWYPSLTDTLNMTRSQQEQFITRLNLMGHAHTRTWQMATSEQTQALKDSLAENGAHRIEHEWPWTPPGSPRHMGSPFLAWAVHADQFFTPTSVATQPLMPGMPPILGGLPMQVYNGRTTGAWYRTDVPTQPYAWADGEADDHFVVSAFKTPGQYATMTFNYDVHKLSDDATTRDGFPGPFGAWIVSEKGPTYTARVNMNPSMLVRSRVNTAQYSKISCQITGLENHTVNYIDANTILLADCAAPISHRFLGGLCLYVDFKTCDILHLLHTGCNELVVTGKLTSGFRFEAKGSIWVW
jgi:hypothetical protein